MLASKELREMAEAQGLRLVFDIDLTFMDVRMALYQSRNDLLLGNRIWERSGTLSSNRLESLFIVARVFLENFASDKRDRLEATIATAEETIRQAKAELEKING